MSPKDAGLRFGSQAAFIITIGRVGAAAAGIRGQLSALGAVHVLHFTEAIRFIPRIWPQFFLRPDAFTSADVDSCVAAYRLFQDERSQHLFVSHLRWRATLDAAVLATPEYDNQYFPEDLIAPAHCATFVDVGAYTGDTLAALRRFAGDSLREYYGFEPDPRNYERLAVEAAGIQSRDLRVVIRRTAVGAAEHAIAFAGDGSATSRSDPGGSVEVPCTTLDALEIARPTYLKIDVEGAESQVLSGGRETVRRWKPTVAIATYHRPTDLFELPLWLARNAPDLRFYLRSHGDAGIDLVCYAVGKPALA